MRLRSLGFVLFGFLAAALCAAASDLPVYPLAAEVQIDRRAAVADTMPLGEALRAVRLGYDSDNAGLRAALAARQGPTPPLLTYMGGFTTSENDVEWLEEDYRRGIAMTYVARLGSDIDATQTDLRLVEPPQGELAVKASTGDGVDRRDRTKFCYWIQIGEEWMKVIAVDPISGRAKVKRGFDGSKKAAHRANAVVLGPVYLGNRAKVSARDPLSWPGAPNRLRYALDPKRPEAQAFKARCVLETMRAGYDGAWWDTFEAKPHNLCDAVGRGIDFPWDLESGRPYDLVSMRDAMKAYTSNVRAIVRRELKREPVIAANSVSPTYAKGGKELIKSPRGRDLLDAYCFEDSYLVVLPGPRNDGDPRRSGPPPATFRRQIGELWLRNVTNQADAAREQLPAICMTGPAGYLATRFNPSLPDYADLLRYAYASFLLTVTAERSTAFGLPLLVQVGEGRRPATAAPWPRILFAPVGDPAQPNEIEHLRVPGTWCFARVFTGGYAAVYAAKEGEPVELTPPPRLVDAETGAPVTSLRLRPGEAAILVRPQR